MATDKFDVSDVPGGIALLYLAAQWFSGKDKDDESMKTFRKTISVFSGAFSKEDEGRWLALLVLLDKDQLKSLTNIEEKLNRFREKEAFRMTLVNAPVQTTLIDVSDPNDKAGNKKIKKEVPVGEYTTEDPRFKFLKNIIDLTNDTAWGVDGVVKMLRTHQLATENKFAKGVHDAWKSMEEDAEETVCQFFGVAKIDEITWTKIAAKIPERTDAEINEGFWAYGIRKYPAWIIGIAIVIVFINTKATVDYLKENPSTAQLVILGGEVTVALLLLFLLWIFFQNLIGGSLRFIRNFRKGGRS